MEDHVSTPSSADKTEQAQSREVSWSSMQQTEVGGPQKAGSGYPKVYNALGFSKAYNFPLYIICAGGFFAFCLSRLEDFNFDEKLSANLRPGLWYYFSQPGLFRSGVIMHLAGAIPAGLLIIFQFTPILRHKFILFHRINGYLVLLLILLSNIGIAIVLQQPAEYILPWQFVGGTVIFLITFSGAMAYWNIKKLQIDQHRAWMLRCVFYLGTAVTSRLIGFAGATIITQLGGYYEVWTCEKIDFTYRQFGVTGILATKYPQCLMPNGTLNGEVVVPAVFDVKAPETSGACANLVTGPAFWLALLIHLVGLEIYLALTPTEAVRLRQISYEKQLAAGMSNPGYAGSTVQGWGDAEKWEPAVPESENRV